MPADTLTPPAAPAAVPAAAPAATPAPTPAAAAPAATPAATPAAAAQPPAAAPAAKPATPGSLLEQAGDTPAPKPGEEPKPGEAPKQGAPEKYADFKLPDGLNLDTKLMDGFTAIAKKNNLSQEGAQEFVSLQAEYAKSSAENLVAQAEQMRAKQIETWQAETKTALGAEWKKELGFAGKALDAFWPPEFRPMLTASGLGDHPMMVKGLVALGKKMSEAAPGEGSRVGITDPKENTNRQMFPKMYDANGAYIGGSK